MTHNRADIIRAAWDASAWQFPIWYTADHFMRDTSEWDAWPIVVQGALVGAIMVKGCELHVCVRQEAFRRWATPGMYRRVLKHKQKHGRLMTRVKQAHKDGIEFVERFGFRLIGNTGDVLLYEMR